VKTQPVKFPYFLFSIALLCSCTDQSNASLQTDSLPVAPAQNQPITPTVEARTFEVVDSLGHSSGWGYDLYVDGKRTIHQPTIPAIAGIHAFRTEYDAKQLGELAAAKIRAGAGLPTISTQELDSLHIRP
jgi:hypothetical protein